MRPTDEMPAARKPTLCRPAELNPRKAFQAQEGIAALTAKAKRTMRHAASGIHSGELPRRRRGSPHSVEQLNKTIAQIYDAAVESEQWPAALGEILRFIGNSGTHLWLMNGETSEVTHSIHVGMPDGLIAEYNGEIIKECPRWANARKHPDRTFLFDYQHIDERDIDFNEYYHWLQTKGDHIRYYLGGRLRAGESVGFQSLAFRKKEGHAQQKHLDRFGRVLPHVEHAMQISQRLGIKRFFWRAPFEILDGLTHGVVILDDKAKVLALNQCAERLLKPPYRLSLRLGRLAATDCMVEWRLYRLISQCATMWTAAAQHPGATLSIPADHGAAPLQLQVFPLRAPVDAFDVARSAVVVFLSDPKDTSAIDSTVLKMKFGLTAAESGLTIGLVNGATLRECSKKMRISANTARSHLKSIFAKVDVHRQAELVSAVLPLRTQFRQR